MNFRLFILLATASLNFGSATALAEDRYVSAQNKDYGETFHCYFADKDGKPMADTVAQDEEWCTNPAAAAANAQATKTILKEQVDAIEHQATNLLHDKLADLEASKLTKDGKPVDPSRKSPSYGYAGIGFGLSAGHTTGTANSISAQGGFRARGFGEGSKGGQYDLEVGSYHVSDTLQNYISEIAERKVDLLGVKTVTERLEKLREVKKELNAKFEPDLKRYMDGVNAHKEAEALKPGPRPLAFYEVDAKYNMVAGNGIGGASEGLYTGVSGHARGGVGFAMKEYGKNGCKIYFLAQADADGNAYYKMENADAASVNAGIEQGPICQIAHLVTIMASPSVQVGGAWHELPDGTISNSGPLNYAGHLRMIVDDTLYLAANAVYRPAMGGSNWQSSEFNGTLDWKISDDWSFGVDGKSAKFQNVGANAQGTTVINDRRIDTNLTLIFE